MAAATAVRADFGLVPDRQLGNSLFVFFLMDRGDERSTLVNDGKQAGRLL